MRSRLLLCLCLATPTLWAQTPASSAAPPAAPSQTPAETPKPRTEDRVELEATQITGNIADAVDNRQEAEKACVDAKARIKELERENRELRQANEILKKASAYFAMAELDRPFRK